jgi:hypothetical protein
MGGFSLPASGNTAAERAAAFVRDHGAVLGVRAPLRPVLRQVRQTRAGAVVRFGLTLQGRPVLGHDLAVTLQGHRVTSASGGVPNLVAADSPLPLLSAPAAARAVRRATGRPPTRVLGLGYHLAGGQARLVWRFDQYRRAPPQRFLLLVDASDGRIRAVGRGFRHAEGYIYDPSPAVAGNYDTRTLRDLTAPDRLEGTYARAFQCGPTTGPMEDLPCANRSQDAAPTDAAGNYFIPPLEPSLSDLFAEVQAYYHVTEFLRWMDTRFGFTWSCGGSQAVDVHVNMNHPNAFWGDANGDPQECGDVSLGENVIDYAYDAEVIYHELTHGVVEGTAGLGCGDVGVCLDDLGLNLIPNGLNEGIADYLSMSFTDSPELGEHAGAETGDPYIRTALQTNRCPWDVLAESHHDGHILMGGLWSLRQTLGADAVDDLLFATLVALPQDAEFDVAAAVMEQVALDQQAAGVLTGADVAAVQQMLGPADRNMTGCQRIIPLDHRPPGYETAQAFGLPSYPGMIDEWPLSLQYTLEAPPNANRLHVTVTAQLGWDTAWTVHLRRDQPVYIQVEMGSPYVVSDHRFTGSPTDVMLTGQSNPPLVPGGTYYVAVVYESSDYELFALTGDVQTGPPIQPDAGVPDAAPPPDTGIGEDATVPRPDARPDAGGGADPAYQPDSLEPRAGCACAHSRAGPTSTASSPGLPGRPGRPGLPGLPLLPLLLPVALIGLGWAARRRRVTDRRRWTSSSNKPRSWTG